ncbi:MAG: chemotaxis protein CheX [Bryobacteraceae bacterium]
MSSRDSIDGVLALIGLAGAWVGSGSLLCSVSTALDLSSRLLMSEVTALGDDVLDAVGEIANMILGSFKNSLETYLDELQMTSPTVVYGKNISAKTLNGSLMAEVRCCYEGGAIVLATCLAPKTTLHQTGPGRGRAFEHNGEPVSAHHLAEMPHPE